MDLFTDSPEKKIEDLTNLINYHNRCYYDNNNPEISDYDYDRLFRELSLLEQQHPQFIRDDSPVNKVGVKVRDAFTKLQHRHQMYSLSNSYDYNDIMTFHERMKKETGLTELNYWVELKYDGLSIELVYEKGGLKSAATRGDGFIGENVTDNVRQIKGVPQRIEMPVDYPEVLEVRGEVILRKGDFDILNNERLERGEALFANPRNAAAGSIRQLDPGITGQRNLDIIFYDIGNINEFNMLDTHEELENLLKQLGFQTPADFKLCSDINDIESFYRDIIRLRDDLDYDIDGLVIKLNNIKQRDIVGFNSRSPKWAVAYKFPATEAVTEIKDIISQVGRTGAVTPVALLEPVMVGGVLISRATLHNYTELRRKDIRIGDSVFVRRAGDVIPEVVKAIVEKRKGDEIQVEKPKLCPSCESPLKEIPGEVVIRCESLSCPEQVAARLNHFVSKEAFNILSLGSSYIENLIMKDKISLPSDLFKLKSEDFFVLERMGEKLATKLYESIQSAKVVTLERFIYSLGIRFVGIRTAKLLAANYNDLEQLKNTTKEQLELIDEIGPRIAAAIIDYFQTPDNLKELNSLVEAGVEIIYNNNQLNNNDKLKGKSFVFTGTLNTFRRSEAAEIVEKLGGRVINAISGKIDYLVYGNNSGSKMKKARDAGVTLLNETEFEELINS